MVFGKASYFINFLLYHKIKKVISEIITIVKIDIRVPIHEIRLSFVLIYPINEIIKVVDETPKHIPQLAFYPIFIITNNLIYSFDFRIINFNS